MFLAAYVAMVAIAAGVNQLLINRHNARKARR